MRIQFSRLKKLPDFKCMEANSERMQNHISTKYDPDRGIVSNSVSKWGQRLEYSPMQIAIYESTQGSSTLFDLACKKGVRNAKFLDQDLILLIYVYRSVEIWNFRTGKRVLKTKMPRQTSGYLLFVHHPNEVFITTYDWKEYRMRIFV